MEQPQVVGIVGVVEKKKKKSSNIYIYILFFLFFFLSDKSCNLSKIVPVLLSASVERFFVSRMRDFSCTILSWKCDSTNLFYMVIHVEKIFKALHCKMCDKYCNTKRRIAEDLQETHVFLVSSQRHEDFRHI